MRRKYIAVALVGALAVTALALSTLLANGAWPGQGRTVLGAPGVDVQICFAIDGSGSIDNTEFELETEGFALAIEDPSIIPQDGSVEVTVKVFATGAATVVMPTVIDSQATADAVATAVRSTDRSGIGTLTDIEEGVNLCVTNITGSPNFAVAGKQAINIATNGEPTTGDPNPATVRDNAVAAGIDRLDAEAVQPGANTAYLLDLVYPQPGELVDPPAVPSGTTGFVLNVDNFNEFADAIALKVPVVIIPTPTPTPTPPPTLPAVGGITEVLIDGSDSPASATEASGSSAPPYAALVGAAAAAALALVAGGWYARRRLS